MWSYEDLVNSSITRIVLTGFMGAGKSTLGAMLGVRLGWRFVDVDQLLTQDAGASVAELFARNGEAAFRELERQAIAAVLAEQQVVLALGGGALEMPSTRDRLLTTPDTHLIFLETPLALAIARCEQQPDAAVRPVLADRAQLAERFLQRAEHYRIAHTTLATAGLTPSELIDLLLAELPPLAIRVNSTGQA